MHESLALSFLIFSFPIYIFFSSPVFLAVCFHVAFSVAPLRGAEGEQ